MVGLLFLPKSLYKPSRQLWRYSQEKYALKFKDHTQPLSHHEARLLLALMGNPLVTREIASEALWNDADEMPDSWYEVLNQVVLHLRLKLRLTEWRVVAEWGRGWHLREKENGTL